MASLSKPNIWWQCDGRIEQPMPLCEGPLGDERNRNKGVVDRKMVLTDGGSLVQSIAMVTSHW
jgi:hypothetical protein